ncbi:hypothetical protein [Apilactobacillus micheneri]|uniref:hypothetical protein n=1 Tax=Apilactobacillus micheneri TaxID=1899430 RepID=UPI0015E84DE9|nr:hypothetical protein [Apilactobacillus micheneri]
MFTLILFVGLNNNSVHAQYKGHHETPTELRGNWYQWDSYNHKFDKLTFNKYSVYENGKLIYGNHNHKANNHLYMYIDKLKKGYGGVNYGFNDKVTMGDPTGYWLSHKKVNGKRVLESYTNTGGFMVYTRQKVHHNYSFTDNNNTYQKIGR